MEVDINGEARSMLAPLPLPIAEVSATSKTDEKPRCSSTPCSPMRQTVSGYQILHMDSNYLVGFTTGEELLKLAQKCTVEEQNNVEMIGPTLRSKQLDSGLSRSSRVCKARSRYYQPYEIPAINGRRRRRMPSSGDKCSKPLPYEPYKAFHGPLPLCLFKGKRAHSKSLDYLNLDRMNIKEPADTEVLQYQLQHLTLRGDRMFARNNT